MNQPCLQPGQLPTGDPRTLYRRDQYETTPGPYAGGPFYEDRAIVTTGPCFLQSLEAVIAPDAGNTYLLVFDVLPSELVPGSSTTVEAAILAGEYVARHSYGPVAQHGTFVREPSELFPLPGPPAGDVIGIPFVKGIFVVASSTPRLFSATAASEGAIALFVRFLRGGL